MGELELVRDRAGERARRQPSLAGALLALALLIPASASAATVPVDALGVLGDEHVVFPPYLSPRQGSEPITAEAVGDVDADGLEDTAVVLDSYEPTYRPSVWVNFSSPTLPASSAAGQPGWRGFRITASDRHLRAPVTGLADVNGDGLGEVVVGSESTLFVVFGRTDGGTVDLYDLGSAGYRITNVDFGTTRGGGTTTGGLASQNTTVTAVEDQSGDGRQDLAFRDGNAVKVLYSPALPAGATVSADQFGDGGYTLDTQATGLADVYLGRLDDLDGDGREDLAVVWDDRETGAVRGVGVLSPGPAARLALKRVADEGRGFELVSPDSYLENAITLGDQNGDGRRDIGFVTAGRSSQRGRSLVVGFSPAVGVRRTIEPPVPGEGYRVTVYSGQVIDVGDQDGDGRSDIAFSSVVRFSSDGRVSGNQFVAVNPPGLGGALFLSLRAGIIVASVADRNDDGKRELVVVHADPYRNVPGDHRATWILDIYASAPPPLPELIDLPIEVAEDALEFGGTFLTAPPGGTSTLGARASVELSDGGGVTTTVAAPDIVDASETRTRAAVRVDARDAGLVAGRTYGYRMVLENGRGLVGASDSRSFTYRPSAAPTPPDSQTPPGPPSGSAPTGLRVLLGTSAPDRLFGTPGRDLLRGLGGPDLLYGGPGADRLEGGPGDDRVFGGAGADRLDGGAGSDRVGGDAGADHLRGGPGRDRIAGGAGADVIEARDGRVDVVLCGPGRDRAAVDRRDRVRACEDLRR